MHLLAFAQCSFFSTWRVKQQSGEKLLNFIPIKCFSELLFAQRRLDDVALLLLKHEDFFLNGAARDELVTRDDTRLADTMHAIGCLIFNGGVPPRIEMNHRVRRGKVQPDTASFEADQKHRRGTALKLFHHFAALSGRAIKITVFDLLLVQLLLEQRQHADELAEQEHAMAAIGDFLEQFVERFELPRYFSRRLRRGRRRKRNRFLSFAAFARHFQQPQVTTNLSQPQQRGEDHQLALRETLRAHRFQNFFPTELHHLLINCTLLVVQFAERDLFNLFRKLGCHIALKSTQNEWL